MSPIAPKNGLLYKNFHSHPAALIKAASGIYLTTNDGRNILGAISGAAVACLRYNNNNNNNNNKEVKQAVIDRLISVPYCHPDFCKILSADGLANFLVDSTGGQMSKAVLCKSGSEAVEVAIKMAKTHFNDPARTEPERSHFIPIRKEPFHSLIAQTSSRVSACSTYRGLLHSEGDDTYNTSPGSSTPSSGAEARAMFARSSPRLSAAAGCVMPIRGYFPAMKAICQRHCALLILGEVMCGMGLTGSLHAYEQEDVVPDLLVVGKGLGAAYAPILAVLVNSMLVDSFQRSGKSVAHGQTYMAHAQAAAAGLRVQQVIRERGLVAHVREVGEYLGRRPREGLLAHPYVGDVRGMEASGG
ncbi:pyridoxal phosphate-dependent transferase [Schizothecium vesticola]|uniref:Pyridoxal phosphate-dependent transferase n=1 Tax=Schizothecium vesticola TaxID=314040 RepID=A0AA40ELH7_9PEZI|nr:pyridoxal phosphate-dependent transferase [Schizothecium vesticola]